MSKCKSCGATIQNKDKTKEGYTKELKPICERCFRIQNYNDYKPVTKKKTQYINILKRINKTNKLVVLVIDIFDLNECVKKFSDYLNNDILLVVTKRDIIPKSVKDKKLLDYIDLPNLNIKDKVLVSSKKNYNFDLLINKIRKYQTNKKVYVVGFTNAGKSTLINKIIENYSENDQNLTTSILPSTTIDCIEVPIDINLTLIDTPGIIDEANISNFADNKMLKKILPKRELRPATYQINKKQTILVKDLFKLECENKNSLTFYISNELVIDRYYKDIELKDYYKHELKIPKHSDIVINGLGFIKVINEDTITLYTKHKVGVEIRPSLI